MLCEEKQTLCSEYNFQLHSFVCACELEHEPKPHSLGIVCVCLEVHKIFNNEKEQENNTIHNRAC